MNQFRGEYYTENDPTQRDRVLKAIEDELGFKKSEHVFKTGYKFAGFSNTRPAPPELEEYKDDEDYKEMKATTYVLGYPKQKQVGKYTHMMIMLETVYTAVVDLDYVAEFYEKISRIIRPDFGVIDYNAEDHSDEGALGFDALDTFDYYALKDDTYDYEKLFFGDMGPRWMYAFSKKYIEKYGREALLKTPAYSVRDLGDQIIIKTAAVPEHCFKSNYNLEKYGDSNFRTEAGKYLRTILNNENSR